MLTAAGKAQSHSIKVVFDYSLLPPSVVPNVRASAPRKHRSISNNENTSVSAKQGIQESVPSPSQPTEPALPAASLSPLFSSSHTVAPPQYEDDEFDEIEDTIPVPVITKFNIGTPAPQRQKVQDTWLEEDVTTLPTVPVMSASPVSTASSTPDETIPPTFIEQGIPQEDDIRPDITAETDAITPMEHTHELVETDEPPVSIIPEESISQEDDSLAEPETEIHLKTPTINAEERSVEPVEAILEPDTNERSEEPHKTDIASPLEMEEPTEITTDVIQPAHDAPEALIETTQDSAEMFQFPPVPAQSLPEHFEAQTNEVTQVTLEPTEQSTDTKQHTTEIPPDPSETSQKSAEQLDAFGTLASSTPIVQDIPPYTNSTEEEETGIDSATIDTENALLPTGISQITKTQNRPRPRTRKKNNRTSVEKR